MIQNIILRVGDPLDRVRSYSLALHVQEFVDRLTRDGYQVYSHALVPDPPETD